MENLLLMLLTLYPNKAEEIKTRCLFLERDYRVTEKQIEICEYYWGKDNFNNYYN